jgi:ABC-type phosphate transport system permease subunit
MSAVAFRSVSKSRAVGETMAISYVGYAAVRA